MVASVDNTEGGAQNTAFNTAASDGRLPPLQWDHMADSVRAYKEILNDIDYSFSQWGWNSKLPSTNEELDTTHSAFNQDYHYANQQFTNELVAAIETECTNHGVPLFGLPPQQTHAGGQTSNGWEEISLDDYWTAHKSNYIRKFLERMEGMDLDTPHMTALRELVKSAQSARQINDVFTPVMTVLKKPQNLIDVLNNNTSLTQSKKRKIDENEDANSPSLLAVLFFAQDLDDDVKVPETAKKLEYIKGIYSTQISPELFEQARLEAIKLGTIDMQETLVEHFAIRADDPDNPMRILTAEELPEINGDWTDPKFLAAYAKVKSHIAPQMPNSPNAPLPDDQTLAAFITAHKNLESPATGMITLDQNGNVIHTNIGEYLNYLKVGIVAPPSKSIEQRVLAQQNYDIRAYLNSLIEAQITPDLDGNYSDTPTLLSYSDNPYNLIDQQTVSAISETIKQAQLDAQLLGDFLKHDPDGAILDELKTFHTVNTAEDTIRQIAILKIAEQRPEGDQTKISAEEIDSIVASNMQSDGHPDYNTYVNHVTQQLASSSEFQQSLTDIDQLPELIASIEVNGILDAKSQRTFAAITAFTNATVPGQYAANGQPVFFTQHLAHHGTVDFFDKNISDNPDTEIDESNATYRVMETLRLRNNHFAPLAIAHNQMPPEIQSELNAALTAISEGKPIPEHPTPLAPKPAPPQSTLALATD